MARKSNKKDSEETRLAHDLPWAALLQGGYLLASRWRNLSEKDRERVRRILADSGGRLTRLTGKQRRDLRKLLGKLDLVGLGRDLTMLARRRGR
ncbi:MAG TPA: hypothetical protein VGG08_00120 [Solirubrobacteraceae bacterium]